MERGVAINQSVPEGMTRMNDLTAIHDEVDIMIVEDNPYDADLIQRALAAQKLATQVVWFQDGLSALNFIFAPSDNPAVPLQKKPRLILLDLNMPIVEGREVLKKLKEDQRSKPIPVVVLTSLDTETDVLQTSLVEANSYIVKPVDFDKFTDTIQRIAWYWLQFNQAPV
jgi:two-component system, response regulator